jgi:DNA-binding transcriptional LysR family regulator
MMVAAELSESFRLSADAHGSGVGDAHAESAAVRFGDLAHGASIERHPISDDPQELSNHASLLFRGLMDRAWLLRGNNGEEMRVPASPRLLSDDLRTLKHAAEAGLGIAALPAFTCRLELRAGRLRRVLPGWTAGGADITMLTTSRRSMLPAVRVFADFLATELPAAMVAG